MDRAAAGSIPASYLDDSGRVDELSGGSRLVPLDTPELGEIPRLVEEVERVRLALGPDASSFHLHGHSWSGLLAIEDARAALQASDDRFGPPVVPCRWGGAGP